MPSLSFSLSQQTKIQDPKDRISKRVYDKPSQQTKIFKTQNLGFPKEVLLDLVNEMDDIH